MRLCLGRPLNPSPVDTYRGFALDRFQASAIESLEAGRSVLVSAPTGTGKTLIADWIVDRALAAGQRVIYTAPIKALSNQKFRDYCRTHGEDRVGLVTGDLVIRRDAPCLVMTTEILRNILLSGEPLTDLRAVVVDEIHFLDDRERGTTWEEVLIYLPKHVQIVGLSATLANLDQFAGWLEHVRQGPVDVVTEHRRTVPLEYHYLAVETGLVTPEAYDQIWRRKGAAQAAFSEPPPRRGGRGQRGRGARGEDRNRAPRNARRTTHLDVFEELRARDLLPFLYFVFSRRDTEILARGLGVHLGRRSLLADPMDQMELNDALDRAARELGPALDPEVRALYARGIAFHHAGLHVQLKALVESLYERRLIQALYCTSTFALGINMPARTAVFDGLKKFDGRAFNPLTTRQFMQKAGRAGRRGLDAVGHVVVRMDLAEYAEFKPLLARYAKAEYEPVHSTFNLSFHSIVNLLGRYSLDRAREVVEKSFLAWHLAGRAQEHLKRAQDLHDAAGAHRDRKEANRLRARAATAENRCWSDFERRLGFLVDHGYLAEDLSFNAGAKVLQNLQISEILVTELVLRGELEQLSPESLFGVLCAVTNELPRRVLRVHRPTREDKELARLVREVRYSDIVVDAEQLTGLPQDCDPDLVPLGRAWARGDALQDVLMLIQSDTDVSGDLITGFRRAKDLAGQLRDVYADVPDMAERLRALIGKVRRDEVEVVD